MKLSSSRKPLLNSGLLNLGILFLYYCAYIDDNIDQQEYKRWDS